MTTRNPIWNTAYGHKSHRQLHAALYDLAAECARRSIEEPPADQSGLDKWGRMTAMGQSAEMLVKSTLAGIDPVLLAADRTNSATLYALTGNARRLPGKINTVGAADAVKRLNDCRPKTAPEIKIPTQLFDVRNDAIHMGLMPSNDDLDKALNELVALVDTIFKVRKELGQSSDQSTFWTSKHYAIVQARQQAGYELLIRQFQELISEAKSDYARLIAGLSDNDRNRMVGELETRQPLVEDDQTSRKHNCPACGNYLWVVYDVTRELELDDSEPMHGYSLIAIVTAHIHHAECPVCNLHLDPDEVMLTDLPFSLDLGTDAPTDDEEDGYRDMQTEKMYEGWEYADLGPNDPEEYGYEEP